MESLKNIRHLVLTLNKRVQNSKGNFKFQMKSIGQPISTKKEKKSLSFKKKLQEVANKGERKVIEIAKQSQKLIRFDLFLVTR